MRSVRPGRPARRRLGRLARLAGAAVPPVLAALVLAELSPAPFLPVSAAVAQEQMLLESDTLIYDQDRGTVVAAGSVRIDYNGTKLVADRVEYDSKGRRLVARGRVEMVDGAGNRTFGDEVNLSDDFRDGFINALYIETAGRTFIGAESGERRDGNITTLNSGVYTACEPCLEKPDKPPIWRIKAARVIWNGKEKVIRFERARFELFGLPIIAAPAFELPDHTVKRKSGVLLPNVKIGPSAVGFGIGVPYYWALSPTYDLTGTFTPLTKQGLLTELEFRQRFNSGDYSVRAAGIYQFQPGLFAAGTHDADNAARVMVGTTGRFEINPRWTFGWKLLAQTDGNFAYTYKISGYSDLEYAQEIYLTGLNDRNYFDLRAMKFAYQEAASAGTFNDTLPWVLPILDYSYVIDRQVAGGEMAFDVNTQHIRRDQLVTSPTALVASTNILGIEGSYTRLTAQAQWRSSIVAPGGLVLSPLLHARGDAIFTNLSAATQAAIAATTIAGVPVASDLRASYTRGMATAGLEARWPILFTSRRTTHVVEPVAQIFVRPDTPFDTVLAIPNEDAQSLVFDAGNLFERDKFSGYDEIEGGVRANVGIRYSATFGQWTVSAVGGQSYHLAGTNSFATPSLVNAGAFSGLETARSDYVAAATVTDPRGNQFLASTRLDETTLELRRLDLRASGRIRDTSGSIGYGYIQAQPLYGFASDRHQVSASLSTKIGQFWSAFGSVSYDIAASNLISTSLGFGYNDECFGITFTTSQSYGAGNAISSQSFGISLSLRTIGDFGQSL